MKNRLIENLLIALGLITLTAGVIFIYRFGLNLVQAGIVGAAVVIVWAGGLLVLQAVRELNNPELRGRPWLWPALAFFYTMAIALWIVVAAAMWGVQ